MYRLAGVFCIVVGCVGWGNGKIGQERDRIRHLRLLLQIFGQIQSEIAYGKRTLPEICLLLTAVKEETYSACFKRIYERISEGDGTGLPKVWEEEFQVCLCKLPLREDERETVLAFPNILCFQEEKGLAGRIGQAEAFLEERYRRAEETYENRSKMIRSVSILTGLLLAILLL